NVRLGQKQTFAVHQRMSALGHKRTSVALFDHLVGLREQRGRDRYAERLSRLEIDHQLELGRCLHRKVGSLLAPKNTINVPSRTSVLVDPIRSVRDQSAITNKGLG